MTVRDALMGILTLGPAYGLQLHHELAERAPHRQKTNVGQIYGTLERLSKAGLVAPAGLSSDGLPLYALTPQGQQVAQEWLEGRNLESVPEWDDLQDMILISHSISTDSLHCLDQRVRELIGEQSSDCSTLSSKAHGHYLNAIRAWLSDVTSEKHHGVRPYAENRTRRGRPKKSVE
jgi:DNA-binding PadR family transcriptional regulator